MSSSGAERGSAESASGRSPRATDDLPTARLAIVGLFVTALVTAQLTASKLLMFGLPFSIPLTGDALILPGAALAYALTFFASDCYAELYGKAAARKLVNVGFAMNFVLLALVWSTIWAPALPDSPVAADTFRQVLGASTGVVVGSLAAYVVSQHWDVTVFHAIREYTDGERLWLRNLGSTATSQLIDTVIFISIAFVVFQGTPTDVALGLVVGQYLLKLAIAVVDTPFVYVVVGYLRSQGHGTTYAPRAAD